MQYISASPGATTTWQVTPLTGSVSGGGLYLIGEAAGTGGTTSLPTTQATGSINLSGTSGTVALVDNSTALTCKTAADCAADPDVVDLVGYGTAVVHEGSADAPAAEQHDLGPAHHHHRTPTRTGPTSRPRAPTPGAPNSTSGGGTGGGGTPGPLRIHDIQGTSCLSPQTGNTVTNVPGIVTGVRATGSSKGYWIQDPNPDSNPATSEGIFVYTGSAPTVDRRRLRAGHRQGPASSTRWPAATPWPPPRTCRSPRSTRPASSVLSSGNALPAPIVLTPTTVPDTYAPDLGGGNIESTPIQPTRSALDFYESIEGMRVEVDNARVVGPSDSYGEQYITTKPDQDAQLPRRHLADGGERHPVRAAGGRRRPTAPTPRSTWATCSPARRSARSTTPSSAATSSPPPRSARCRATTWPPVVATGRPRSSCRSRPTTSRTWPRPTRPASTRRLAARRRHQPGQPRHHRGRGGPGQRRRHRRRHGRRRPDDRQADRRRSTAAGGPQYDSREIDPVNDQDGGEPGGNIRVVFLYNPAG